MAAKIDHFKLERSTTEDFSNGVVTVDGNILPITTLTAAFTVPPKSPVENASANATVVSSAGFTVDRRYLLEGGGAYQCTAKPNATTVTLLYLDEAFNIHSGLTIISGTQLVPGDYDEATPPGNGIWYRLTGYPTEGDEFPYNIVNIAPPGQIQWARFSTGSSSGVAQANSMAVDSVGNVIIAGFINGTVDFSIPGHAITPIASSSSQESDAFIVKYNSSGHPIWAKKIGGVLWNDSINGITTDSSGNIIVTGFFTKTVDFGGTSLTSAPGTLGQNEQADMFVAKYTTAGALLWVRGFGQYGPEQGNAIKTDSSGSVFLAGKFSTTNADFGNPGTPIVLSSVGSNDIILLKLNGSTGATMWAKRWGGNGDDAVNRIAITNTGDLFVIGSIPSGVTTNIDGTTTASASYLRIFVAKYSGLDGSPITTVNGWPKIIGNGKLISGDGIAIDSTNGNVIITGGCRDTINFGGGDRVVLDTEPSSAIFLVTYNSSGTHVWSKVYGAIFVTTTIAGRSVAIDSNSNIAVVGIAIAPMYMGESYWTEAGNGYFLAMFNSLGVFQHGMVCTGGNSSTGKQVVFDSFGHVLTCGVAAGPVNFGGGFVSGAQSGYNASFVAQYNK